MGKFAKVLVVGGGPAGSTAATLLAREGFDVTIMEKEIFPRYHIGESLLLSSLPILDLLGAKEKIDAYGFQRKRGGYFDWGGEQWDMVFSNQYSYQVQRADFDQILLEHAKSQGVTVLAGVFHSPLMQDAQDELAEVIADLPLRRGHTPLISSVTGEFVTDVETYRAGLSAQNHDAGAMGGRSRQATPAAARRRGRGRPWQRAAGTDPQDRPHPRGPMLCNLRRPLRPRARRRT